LVNFNEEMKGANQRAARMPREAMAG
jgi:hypothetical protein